ncbi:MAG: hypothetical protein V4736_03450 [Bdellovibrionota bacterium]
MQFRQRNAVFMAILASGSLNLMSCSGGSSGAPAPLEQVVSEDLSGYKKASCLYDYNQGPSASQKRPDSPVSTYFGKNLNNSLLEPVLAASAAEVVRFAETTDVRFYRTSSHMSGTCDFMKSISQTPTDLESEFAKVNGDNTILGLYLNVRTPNVPTTNSEAAITVRKDSNKWVLVHEYMHHLFHIQLNAEYGETTGIKEQVNVAFAEYEAADKVLKAAPTTDRKEPLKLASQKLINLDETVLSLLKQYLLEEMTIESHMGEKLERGQLKLVLPAQRINGAAYVLSSAKKTQEIMELFKQESKKFQTLYGWDLEKDDADLLRKAISEFSKIESEMDTLKLRARAFLKTQGLVFNGLQSISMKNGKPVSLPLEHVGCSHEKIANQMASDLKSKFKNRE